jgi:hypothetical protein
MVASFLVYELSLYRNFVLKKRLVYALKHGKFSIKKYIQLSHRQLLYLLTHRLIFLPLPTFLLRNIVQMQTLTHTHTYVYILTLLTIQPLNEALKLEPANARRIRTPLVHRTCVEIA